ncbi:amidohydrolase [Brevibacillus daliensis]|uniref:amidohydrolase n=1 Tax=Brevibacillus daliensis TaxID=2892995 RepID=UPI001E5B90DA|nr:amidohydrolase [Brevibacillus daliensis]
MSVAITNATIIIGDGTKLDKGTIVIEQGMITAVGTDIDLSHVKKVIDANGKFVTPGIIDVHTHLGVHEEGIGKEGADYNETSSPLTPHVRSLDGINPLEVGFEIARRSGVTTVQIMPGSANVIGGEMVTIKTTGTIVDKMILREPSGMKAAFGENPKRVFGTKDKSPVTRMGLAALLRQQFMQAQDYKKAREHDSSCKRDLGLENLVKVLDGKIPLRAHAHRADDIVTVLRLANEFGIQVTIEHCTEGHKIAPFLKEKGVRVSVGPTLSSRSKVETAEKGFHTLLALAEAGVPFSITTDHPVVNIEYLITTVSHAVRSGLDESLAWMSVTLNAAKHLGVDDHVGSLEAGKDADIVLWNGDPLDIHRSRVEKTWIDGVVVFEAE